MLNLLNPVHSQQDFPTLPFTYRAFGLNICSDIPLPEEQTPADPGDVIVRQGKLHGEHLDGNEGSGFYAADPTRVNLYVSGVGSFQIRQGREIVYDVPDLRGIDRLSSVVSGQGLAVILHQRGRLVLHGSAVTGSRGALVLLGPCGSGKSTLAAALARRGYAFVTDDIVGIEWSDPVKGGIPRISRGFRRARLAPDSLAALSGESISSSGSVFAGSTKSWFTPESTTLDEAPPLNGVFVLDSEGSNRVYPLNIRDAFSAVIENAYTGSLAPATETADIHIIQCTRLVRNLPFYRLSLQQGIQHLDAAIDQLEAHFASL